MLASTAEREQCFCHGVIPPAPPEQEAGAEDS
jgi:hypothetical protein